MSLSSHMLASLFKHLLKPGAARRPPAEPVANRLLAAVRLQRGGELAQAEAIYRAILELDPENIDVLHLLGNNLLLQRRPDEAIALLQRVIAAQPDCAEAFYNLGGAFRAGADLDNALLNYRKAVELRPEFVEALSGLAGILKAVGSYDEAETCYRRALALNPDFAEAHYNFGNLLHLMGRVDDAIASYRRAIAIKPDFVTAHSNLIYALNFHPGYEPRTVFEAHLEWARRHAEPLTRLAAPHRNTPLAERRLRVGYVSPNFRDHAAAYFFEPVLVHHDPQLFEIVCYSDVARPDALTQRLRQYQAEWRDCTHLDDRALAELVRRDAIDILVDLTGHTENNRLLVFARKPAPVQVTWNGYANTTGMSAIGYRVSDAYADPPGTTEHLHTERLVRLPGIYMAFRPPGDSPPVGELPCERTGYVTFASFNALAKITPHVVALWARILSAVPAARLMMATVPMGSARERVAQMFAEQGVDTARLELHGRLPFQEFLALHQRADIALDPFPFHGTTTTCHTLWMGIPVITRAGASHVSRVGVSMLSNLGLARLIAQSDDEYVEIARSLAADLPGLNSLRRSLRNRLLGAPNTDGLRLTRHLECAYRDMWRAWCRTQNVDVAGQT
jgi:protein O-GlcNAc transferase